MSNANENVDSKGRIKAFMGCAFGTGRIADDASIAMNVGLLWRQYWAGLNPTD